MKELSALELSRLAKMSLNEKRLHSMGFLHVAGVDEVGRGPLAGPVVAAACILPQGSSFANLNDSKQLKQPLREALFSQFIADPNLIYGIGIVDPQTIDRINILQATFLAMKQAVANLRIQPDYILIDGNQIPHFQIPNEAIVQGDRLSMSIAAASIIAKVTRDWIMEELDVRHPGYGFKQHKGYGTKKHLEMIFELGPLPIHRKSFEPIKSIKN